MLATMTSKGQVTVPSGIRERLHLKAGDRLDFVLDENGHIELIPVHGSMRSLKGLVPKPRRPVSLEEMEAAIGCGGERT